jgi:hypothetical protein
MDDTTEYVGTDHDKISERVRIDLSVRLSKLMNSYEMFLDSDPRDFSPAQVANYLTTAKLLGSLWQSFQRPVDRSGLIPADRVEKMIEAACAQAVTEALEAERALAAAQHRMALESAGTGVREALARERDRRSRAS